MAKASKNKISPNGNGSSQIKILKEIMSRLQFMQDVGLNYLTMGRAATTLSGGESQTNSARNSNRLAIDGLSLYFG